MHVVPTHSEEDAEGGKEEPKDHSSKNCRLLLHVGVTNAQNQQWHVCHQKKDIYREKHLIPTIKYGGESLMLWGCFADSGSGALVQINGIMN